MSVIIASPFNLIRGEEIVARVAVLNDISVSPVSELSSTH